jgi:hypothetical protein
MSDSGVGGARDPVVQAAARLEAAVERLAQAIAAAMAQGGPGPRASAGPAAENMIPRAEVAAIADRLDATLLRLRGALAEELRRPEEEWRGGGRGGPEEE